MLNKWVLCLGLVIVLLGVSACGSAKTAEIKLGAGDDGREIELKQGQVMAISLDSNPTTGYSWAAVDLDEAILRSEGEAEFKSEGQPGVVGAGGVETLRFKAVSAGRVTLKLAYRRSWEQNVEPIQTWSVSVIVR